MSVSTEILNVLKEGLAAYKKFLSTRQETYNRKQDAKQVKAIESAEKYIFAADALLIKLNLDEKEFKTDLNTLNKYRKRFFHYH